MSDRLDISAAFSILAMASLALFQPAATTARAPDVSAAYPAEVQAMSLTAD